ncbi:hypothetical protein [Leifsonia sp. ZF2019]|uniref:hypothetical protein n=1 Tax=Leifsonia sp. ZF2019 TaxID=2781978 RepID=UPI001CBABED4|nr:hypothetical protein [Leifsonia sp. ZF2019]
MTLELDGEIYPSRALAIGPETAPERLLAALPLLTAAADQQLRRHIAWVAAEAKKKAAGVEPAAE